LQPRERLQVRLGQQVRPAGEHLPQLHERRTHRLQIIGELLGQGFAGRRGLDLLRVDDFAVGRDLLRQVGPAVFPQEAGDFFVTFEMEG